MHDEVAFPHRVHYEIAQKALSVERRDEVHVAIVGLAKGLNDARIGALSRRNIGFECAVNSLIPAISDRRDHLVLRSHHWVLRRLTNGRLRRR